jgi:hypothetical protein
MKTYFVQLSAILARLGFVQLVLHRVYLCFAMLVVASPNEAGAQQIIKLSNHHWLELNKYERDSIQQKYVVNLIDQNSFGTVVDSQAINESSSGSNAGSSLGRAFGNASYVDKALKSGNYSARDQLGANLLGALVGSAFNSDPVARFHFRYAVKLSGGDIKYIDQIKSQAFRHPVGICVSVPALDLIEQQLCTQTLQTIRNTYLPFSQQIMGYGEVKAITNPNINSNINAIIIPPIQIGDSIIASNAVSGFKAPIKTQQPFKVYPKGTTFETVLISRDFFQFIDPEGQLIWIEKGSILSQAIIAVQGIPNEKALDSNPSSRNDILPLESPIVQVNCKLGNLAPVRTSSDKCKAINGVEIQ